jgi:hypothetical protein
MVRFLVKIWEHFLYPISHPSQVLNALGISDQKCLNFRHFLRQIVTRAPKNLYRKMPRLEAEKAFSSAYKKEVFHHMTLISYCFYQGWLELVLEFDGRETLRRLYVQHGLLNSSQSIELEIPELNEKEIMSQSIFKNSSISLTKRLLKKITFSNR